MPKDRETNWTEVTRQQMGGKDSPHHLVASERTNGEISLAHVVIQEDGTEKYMKHAKRLSKQELIDFCDNVFEYYG